MWNHLKRILGAMWFLAPIICLIASTLGCVVAVVNAAVRTAAGAQGQIIPLLLMFSVLSCLWALVETDFAKSGVVAVRRVLFRCDAPLSRKADARVSLTALLARQKGRKILICDLAIIGLFTIRLSEIALVNAVGDWVIFFALMFLLVVLADAILNFYWVYRGYFRTTETEARKLTQYILKNSFEFAGGVDDFKVFEDVRTEKQIAVEIQRLGVLEAAR